MWRVTREVVKVRGFRLLAVLLPCVPLLVGAAPVAAQDDGLGYLALGDSVAFGTGLCLPTDPRYCVGYPEHLSDLLESGVVNASCPGEASGGFISLTGTDLSCRTYRAQYPLHVQYTTSQLDFAVYYLRTHHHIGLVTIDLGVNDVLALQAACASSQDPAGCLTGGLPVTLQTLAANLDKIYGAIRSAGFTGHLVALTYYVLDFNDQTMLALASGLNATIRSVTTASAFGGLVADGFAAFQKASSGFGGNPFAAGLVMPGDIHPTAAGQTLLASTILNTIGFPDD